MTNLFYAAAPIVTALLLTISLFMGTYRGIQRLATKTVTSSHQMSDKN